MYKIVDKINHEIWLGTEQAVIRFANYKLSDKDEDWFDFYRQDLEKIGYIGEKINNIELAMKFLQNFGDFEVVDLGDILEDLKNNEPILISQEE